MTLDEAIRHCEKVAKENKRIAFDLTTAFNMETIKSKECKKCANEHRQLAEWLRDYKRLKEREPCEDAISRQAVKEQMIQYGFHAPDMTATEFVEDLPSVTPQPKMKIGKWIIMDIEDCELFMAKCSECGVIVDSRMISKYLYCHYCGAKMVEPQESEEG